MRQGKTRAPICVLPTDMSHVSGHVARAVPRLYPRRANAFADGRQKLMAHGACDMLPPIPSEALAFALAAAAAIRWHMFGPERVCPRRTCYSGARWCLSALTLSPRMQDWQRCGCGRSSSKRAHVSYPLVLYCAFSARPHAPGGGQPRVRGMCGACRDVTFGGQWPWIRYSRFASEPNWKEPSGCVRQTCWDTL